MIIGDAILNAAAFTGGNYLERYLSGDNGQAALDEKIRHDKSLEQYQAAYEKWQKDRTELLDWVAEQDREKDKAIDDFQTTDRALALYNQTHRAKVALPKEPEFSEFYKPTNNRKIASYCSSVRTCLRLDLQSFAFFKHIIYGCQTIKDLLQPPRLLERSGRSEKTSFYS